MNAGWLLLGCLGLIITLPATLELLLVSFGAWFYRPPSLSSSSPLPQTVILIPAHNEELTLSRVLASLQQCEGKFDVVVIAHNCTDRTAEIAEQEGVKVLQCNDSEHQGKSYALEHAIQTLPDYDLYLFIDADAQLSPNFITEMQRASLYAPVIQALYLQKETQSLKQRLAAIAFAAYNYCRPAGRSALGLSAGIVGNGFAVRRSTLRNVPFVHHLVEDAAYHLQLVAAGEIVLFDAAAVTISSPASTTQGRTQQNARWEGGRLRLALEESSTVIKQLLQGKWRFVEPLLALWTLPLVYYALILLLLLFFPFTVLKLYALTSLAILAFHIATTLYLRKQVGRDILALLTAPSYLIWKLLTLTKIVKTAKDGQTWIRTERKGPKEDK